MSPAEHITLGPLALSITPLIRPVAHKPSRDMIALSATISTDSSSSSVESLAIELTDLIRYRHRLRKFTAREDEGAASFQITMPHFDLALIHRQDDSIRAEVRLSSDLRTERHTYEFDTTFLKVSAFADSLDLTLLSLSLR